MRRITLRLIAAILTFCLGVACAAIWLYSTAKDPVIPEVTLLTNEVHDGLQIPTVSLCALMTSPNLYRHSIVRVRAFLVAGKKRLDLNLLETGCSSQAVWVDAWIEGDFLVDATDSERARARLEAELAFESELKSLLGSEISNQPFIAEVEAIGRFAPYDTGEPRFFIIKLSQAILHKFPVPKRPHIKRDPC